MKRFDFFLKYDIIENERVVIAMNEYKYYFYDNEEHFEIWQDNKLIDQRIAPYGQSFFEVLLDNADKSYTIDSVISNLCFYYAQCTQFFDNKEKGVLSDNLLPSLPITSNFYFFVRDIIKQYQENKIDTSPSENTWFVDFREENHSLTNHFFETFVLAENCFDNWSKGKNEINQTISSTPLNIKLETKNNTTVEVLCPTSLVDLIYYLVLKTNQLTNLNKLWVIRCKRCNRIFANFKQGRTVVYCNYKDQWGKSCRERVMDYIDNWNKSDHEKKIQKLYIKYYDEQRRKQKRKEITKEQFTIWSKNARAMRDLCKKGEITEEDFIKWLDENKENYTE